MTLSVSKKVYKKLVRDLHAKKEITRIGVPFEDANQLFSNSSGNLSDIRINVENCLLSQFLCLVKTSFYYGFSVNRMFGAIKISSTFL